MSGLGGVCLGGVSGSGGVWSWGGVCLVPGVSALGGVWSREGVSGPRGCLLLGGVSGPEGFYSGELWYPTMH